MGRVGLEGFLILITKPVHERMYWVFLFEKEWMGLGRVD